MQFNSYSSDKFVVSHFVALLVTVLMAQETDWMDKLEKRLRRSPKMAADAEEISEELDVS